MPEMQFRTQGSVRETLKIHFDQHHRNTELIEKHSRGLSAEDELPPYVHQDFPKAMFAPDGETIVVQNAQEERVKLGEGWYPSYAALLEAAQASVQHEDQEEETAPPSRRRR